MKLLKIVLLLFMWGGTGWVYARLPSFVPTHWNYKGEIDGYMPKVYGAWLLPSLTLLMALSFRFAVVLDPKKAKYHLFAPEWEIMQTGLIAFFVYLHAMMMYIALHPGVPLLPTFFVALGGWFIFLGNYLSKIRQNYFIGIKVPWTLANEDNWNKTHRFASWTFVLAGLITVLEALVSWQAPAIILTSILLAAVLPILYSFWLYKKQE